MLNVTSSGHNEVSLRHWTCCCPAERPSRRSPRLHDEGETEACRAGPGAGRRSLARLGARGRGERRHLRRAGRRHTRAGRGRHLPATADHTGRQVRVRSVWAGLVRSYVHASRLGTYVCVRERRAHVSAGFLYGGVCVGIVCQVMVLSPRSVQMTAW